MIAFVLKRVIGFVPTNTQPSKRIAAAAFGVYQLCLTPGHAFYSSQRLSPPQTATESWEATLDKDTKQKLFEIRVELTTMYESGEKVCDPTTVTPDEWKHFLSVKSKTARLKSYNYIGRKVNWKRSSQEKKERYQQEGEKKKEIVLKERQNENHIIYGLGHTTLLPRIYTRTMSRWRDTKIWTEMQFNGSKIVFDMDYDKYMNTKYRRYTANHLKMTIADNRKNRSPFIIHMCNVNMETETMKQLETLIPTLRKPLFPVEVHEKCFSELFPSDKLVYLTPYSPNTLRDFNHDDIFVVPGIIDKGSNGPVTMAKAKKLGIRTAYLPLTRYLSWGSPDKALPLNIISNVLLDFKNTQDWKTALLKHAPQRKLRQIRGEREMVGNAIDNASSKEKAINKGNNLFENNPTKDDNGGRSRVEKTPKLHRLINIKDIFSKNDENKSDYKNPFKKK